jgi:hypothetical protein
MLNSRARLHRIVPKLPARYRDHYTAAMTCVRTLLLGRSDLVLWGNELPDAIVPLLSTAVAARHTRSNASRVTRLTENYYARSSSIPLL